MSVQRSKVTEACLGNSWCQLGAGVYYGRLEGVGINFGRIVYNSPSSHTHITGETSVGRVCGDRL